MGRGEALVRDANEGGQSFAARPGEVEDAALGSALMASGVATALSPSARRVVACSMEQMVSSVAGSTGWEGKSVGRGREALMAGQYSPGWRSELRQAAMMPCSALRSGSREAEQRREKGGRERVDFDFSQKF